MQLSVYCSGSIIKGTSDEKKVCWGDAEKIAVTEGAGTSEVIFLNPDDPITDSGNVLGQFGRNMYQVAMATAVVVDARERRGLGVGVEMAAAATLGTPVIVVAPRNSKYRCDSLEYRGVVVNDYVHPHVSSLAAAIVGDFSDAGLVLSKLPTKPPTDCRIPAWLDLAITEYTKNILQADVPMLEALNRLHVDLGNTLR